MPPHLRARSDIYAVAVRREIQRWVSVCPRRMSGPEVALDGRLSQLTPH